MHSYLRMQAERRQTSICSGRGLYWRLPTDGAAPRGPHQRLMSGRGTSALQESREDEACREVPKRRLMTAALKHVKHLAD